MTNTPYFFDILFVGIMVFMYGYGKRRALNGVGSRAKLVKAPALRKTAICRKSSAHTYRWLWRVNVPKCRIYKIIL